MVKKCSECRYLAFLKVSALYACSKHGVFSVTNSYKASKMGEEALVSCGTTKGPIVMRMHRDWSPNGYDRVVELFERVRSLGLPC